MELEGIGHTDLLIVLQLLVSQKNRNLLVQIWGFCLLEGMEAQSDQELTFSLYDYKM